MNLGLVFTILFFVLTVLGIVTYAVYLIVSREKKKWENSNIILNFMPQFCDGYAIGIEVNSKKIGDRELITYQSTDADNKEVDLGKKVELQTIPIGNNKIITHSCGNLSSRRTIKFLLPPDASYFSKEFRETLFGKALVKLTEEINAENVVVDTLLNKNKVEDKLLKRVEGKERVEEYITHDEELNSQILKKVLDTPKNQTNTSPDRYPGRI